MQAIVLHKIVGSTYGEGIWASFLSVQDVPECPESSYLLILLLWSSW